MNCLIWILLLLGCSGNACGRGTCGGNCCSRDRGGHRHDGGCRDNDCGRKDHGCGSGGHHHGKNDCGCENRDRDPGNGCRLNDCDCREEHIPMPMPCGACDGQGHEDRGRMCDANMAPPAWQDYPVLPRREGCDCED